MLIDLHLRVFHLSFCLYSVTRKGHSQEHRIADKDTSCPVLSGRKAEIRFFGHIYTLTSFSGILNKRKHLFFSL
jgi:hypothetical protein